MTAINFPAAPATGATHTEAGITWTFDGTTWDTTGVGYVAQTSAKGAAMLPAGITSERPASPVTGATRWNSTLGFLEVFTGSVNGWKQLEPLPLPAVLPADMHITTSTKLNDGTYYVNALTIDAGVTVTSETQALVFICTGNAVINGTINLDGKGPGGDGYQNHSNPHAVVIDIAGTKGGGMGAGGKNTDAVPYTPFVSLVGSAGGTGHIRLGPGNTVGQNPGGAGGGGVLIRAYGSITINPTGLISANGYNADRGAAALIGAAAPAYQLPGSGGGSGGTVCLHSDGPIVHNGVISVTGGAGSPPYASSVAPIDGGGGGGGGIVVTQSAKGTTGTGTFNVAGGAAGIAMGGSTGSGAAGGSNGGRGGYGLRFNGPTGNAFTVLPGPGEAGKILSNGSPI